MMKWPNILITGSALILLTNAVALVGAAYNRSGTPESQLRLSQRELQNYQWSDIKDNSGITLNLNWRIEREAPAKQLDYGLGYSAGKWGTPAWLNQAKLAELGFDMNKLTHSPGKPKRNKEFQSREVLLVLEQDGHAYQQELQRARDYAEKAKSIPDGNHNKEEYKRIAKSAEEIYQHELWDNSRLFAIDAGVDLRKLRETYPDNSRYAIVHGVIQPNTTQEKNKTQIVGYITELHAERINVPLIYRRVFDTATPYEVTVAFGKRLEPWLTEASKSMTAK